MSADRHRQTGRAHNTCRPGVTDQRSAQGWVGDGRLEAKAGVMKTSKALAGATVSSKQQALVSRWSSPKEANVV